MSDDENGYFNEEIAATYDSDSSAMFDEGIVGPTVDVLAQLAGGSRALEFGIGTGRIALPLARRGVEVHGIDLSRAMVARLRAKPGGAAIGITIGDFATTRAPGEFSLAYPRRPSRLLHQRRQTPQAWRQLCHRGFRPRPAAASPGSKGRPICRRKQPLGLRPV
jgi:SAM-dependent methyltransferase